MQTSKSELLKLELEKKTEFCVVYTVLVRLKYILMNELCNMNSVAFGDYIS